MSVLETIGFFYLLLSSLVGTAVIWIGAYQWAKSTLSRKKEES